MDFSFVDALAFLAKQAGQTPFDIANTARPPSSYMFNLFLPERNETSYRADRGGMTIRTTMAALVGMDSVYPPGSLIEGFDFGENTLKAAIDVGLSEEALRTIQELLQHVQRTGASSNEAMVQEALNFYNKVVLQAHFDLREWARGQALALGKLEYKENDLEISVSYGVPSGNLFSTRTTVSTEAYGAAGSKFWTDHKAARKLLRGGVPKIVGHPDTVEEVIYNDVNKMRIVGEGDGFVTVQRYVGSTEQLSSDQREKITFYTYDLEGEVYNPAGATKSKKVPFCPKGKLIYVGPNRDDGYRVGEGSVVDNPELDLALGYTHIGPTVEGGGRPGMWGRLYVPEATPWRLHGQAAANFMPVIEAPKKIVVLSTELAE